MPPRRAASGCGRPQAGQIQSSPFSFHPMPLHHLPIPVDMESLPIFHRAEIHPRFSPDSHFRGLQSNFFRRMVKLFDLDFDKLRRLDFQWFRVVFFVPHIARHLCRRWDHPGIMRHFVCHLATIYGCQDNRNLCQKKGTRVESFPASPPALLVLSPFRHRVLAFWAFFASTLHENDRVLAPRNPLLFYARWSLIW